MPKLNKLIEGELIFFEFADGERGPVDRKWRHNSVDARAVGQARVANWRGFVNATPDLTDNALADIQQLLIVTETNGSFLNLALNFDVNRTRAVHHDVGNVVAREQRFQRTKSEDVIAEVLKQVFLLCDRHHDAFDRDDLVDNVTNFFSGGVHVQPRQLGEIDRLDQRAENSAFGLVVRF